MEVSCEPPKSITLVRCPECGSTNAGEVESRSAYDLTYMRCRECGHGGFADHWQLTFAWNVEGELIGDELPEYLEPLAPGEDLASSLHES